MRKIARGCGHATLRALAQGAAPRVGSSVGHTRLSSRALAAAGAPAQSALLSSSKRLREAFASHESTAEIAKLADAPLDEAAALAALGKELRAGREELEVRLLGEVLEAASGRRTLEVNTPTGPGGGPAERSLSMVLPMQGEIAAAIAKRRADKGRMEKPEAMADVLEKYVNDCFLGKRTEHVVQLSAWGPKTLGDSQGEFGEIAALMLMQIRAYRAALRATKEDGQFEIARQGDGKDCLVMPPSNFALLGLKDIVNMLLQGYRVIAIVQPRFFAHYRLIEQDLAECGLPTGILDVVPGLAPEADPEVLYETLRHVDRLQFTGSSAMFKALVKKAYELGNLRLEHAGEVSGMNKVTLSGVSVSHPAVVAGTAMAAMGNNGELCTSASLVEFDGEKDTAEAVKAALEGHSFRLGKDPEDLMVDVLLKPGKTEALEVKTQLNDGEELREWWEKTIMAVPQGSSTTFRTNQSLGHGVFAPTLEQALTKGVAEDASNIYCVGVSGPPDAPCARAGTTGAKLPESIFGAHKTHTFAVAGDHDGVGSVQTLLTPIRRRGANWRDSEEAYAEYELTETAEMLVEFLGPRDQKAFPKQVSSMLEVFEAFMPRVSAPYNGQALVNGSGRSQLLSFPALKSVRKNILIQRDIELPEDAVKLAILSEMSPLREIPVTLHLLSGNEKGRIEVKDPLKSFLRVVERRLGWKVEKHSSVEELAAAVRASEYPPYFYCARDRHMLPVEVLMAVADQGGYFYEGLPTDALTLFRWLTTTQAWTASCTEAQLDEGEKVLNRLWKSVGLRQEAHEAPTIVQPTRRRDDDFGGMGATGLGGGSDDLDLSSTSSDSESDDPSAQGEGTGKASFSESKPTADSTASTATSTPRKPVDSEALMKALDESAAKAVDISEPGKGRGSA